MNSSNITVIKRSNSCESVCGKDSSNNRECNNQHHLPSQFPDPIKIEPQSPTPAPDQDVELEGSTSSSRLCTRETDYDSDYPYSPGSSYERYTVSETDSEGARSREVFSPVSHESGRPLSPMFSKEPSYGQLAPFDLDDDTKRYISPTSPYTPASPSESNYQYYSPSSPDCTRRYSQLFNDEEGLGHVEESKMMTDEDDVYVPLINNDQGMDLQEDDEVQFLIEKPLSFSTQAQMLDNKLRFTISKIEDLQLRIEELEGEAENQQNRAKDFKDKLLQSELNFGENARSFKKCMVEEKAKREAIAKNIDIIKQQISAKMQKLRESLARVERKLAEVRDNRIGTLFEEMTTVFYRSTSILGQVRSYNEELGDVERFLFHHPGPKDGCRLQAAKRDDHDETDDLQ